MTTVDVTKARGHFTETINSVAYRGEHIVIQQHGKAVAALIPVEDLELIERMEGQIDLEMPARPWPTPRIAGSRGRP